MPEDLSHIDHSDSHEQPPAEDPVLADIGANVDLQPEYFSMILHQAMKSRLEPLKTKGSMDPVERRQLAKRNRAIMVLGAGVPRSEKEVSTLLEGAPNKLRSAWRTKNGPPRSAVKYTYEAIVKFWQDSDKRLGILDRAITTPEGLEVDPDPQVIRHLLKTDPEYRKVFEDYFFEKESLDHYNWRKAKKDRKNYAAHLVMHMAENAYPDYLKAAHKSISNSEEARLRAWTDQIKEVRQIPFVQSLLADTSYTPPSLNSRRHASRRELDNADYNAAAESVQPSTPRREWAGFVMPPEVSRQLEGKYDSQNQRIQTHAEQSSSVHAAELGEFSGPAIYNEEGKIVGYELPDDQPSAEALVKHELARKERWRKRLSKRR